MIELHSVSSLREMMTDNETTEWITGQETHQESQEIRIR